MNSSKSMFSELSLSGIVKKAMGNKAINDRTRYSLDFLENNTRSLSEIMNTWNGRDKLLAIIQYSCGVYVQALKKTHPMEENIKFDSYQRSKRVKDNLSSGRKVFRLLKFSDEIANIIAHARGPNKNNFLQEILFYSSGICSFFYYLLDNIIWLSSKKFKLLGKIKDIFSLMRCLFEICKWLYELANDLKKEETILKKLGLYDDCFISETEESYKLIKDLIVLRRQMSFYVLELITNVLRTFMLYKSLKLMGSVYLDNIFVELCGVFSSFFALLKSVRKKSFEKKERKKAQEKLEQVKKAEIMEEEKRSKELFNINNMEMSVDDSDIEDPNFMQPYTINPFHKFKSSMSSTHDISQSQKSNGKLKHVRSTLNVKNGKLNGLKNYQQD